MNPRLAPVAAGVVLVGLSALDSEPSARGDTQRAGQDLEASATIKENVIRLLPSGATFEIPRRWLDWHANFKNNLHLTRKELEKVRSAEGDWDKGYAEVVNAALPFSACAAHVGGEGWGSEAVSFADLQVRAYVVDMSPEQVQDKVTKQGAARASKVSKNEDGVADVSVSQSKEGKWRRATVTYSVWYGDYGGKANVDVYAREFGKQTAVLVFMHADGRVVDTGPIPEIVKSFAWKSDATDGGKDKK